MDVLARARALAAADVLGAIAAPALVVLAERARPLTLAPDQTAATMRDGDRVALVVADGVVDDGTVQHGPGAVLGLAGVLAAGAPTTTVTARAATVLLELDGDDVVDLLAEHPEAARALAKIFAAALRGERR